MYMQLLDATCVVIRYKCFISKMKEYRKLHCFSQVEDYNRYCELDDPDSSCVCEENEPAWMTGCPPLHTLVNSDGIYGAMKTIVRSEISTRSIVASLSICGIFM